jgi:hypothetical protein
MGMVDETRFPMIARMALLVLLALALSGCGPWFFGCLIGDSKSWICKS